MKSTLRRCSAVNRRIKADLPYLLKTLKIMHSMFENGELTDKDLYELYTQNVPNLSLIAFTLLPVSLALKPKTKLFLEINK